MIWEVQKQCTQERICMNKALIDSNILIYAHDTSSSYHTKALHCIKKQIQLSTAVFSIQNYLESYRIWTQKILKPISSKFAWGIIDFYLDHPDVQSIFSTAEVFNEARKLSIQHNKVGVHIFDVQLVAMMNVFGISTLYTANTKDFEEFDEINVVNPL